MCKKPRKTAFFREKSRFFAKKKIAFDSVSEIFGQKKGHFFFCGAVERISKKSAKNTGPPRGFWPKIAKKCQKWPFLTLFSGHFSLRSHKKKRTFPKFSGFCAKIEQKRVFFRGFSGFSGLRDPDFRGFFGVFRAPPRDFPGFPGFSGISGDFRAFWALRRENTMRFRGSEGPRPKKGRFSLFPRASQIGSPRQEMAKIRAKSSGKPENPGFLDPKFPYSPVPPGPFFPIFGRFSWLYGPLNAFDSVFFARFCPFFPIFWHFLRSTTLEKGLPQGSLSPPGRGIKGK